MPMAPFMMATSFDRTALADSPDGYFGTGSSFSANSTPTITAKLAIATAKLAISCVQVPDHRR
jgi:hypothetical protein